ncbi:MAG: hypothetical protein MUP93_03395, partial [Pirellulales bacterium]|nr:hypothetical protein [Pirellulales bacterium]
MDTRVPDLHRHRQQDKGYGLLLAVGARSVSACLTLPTGSNRTLSQRSELSFCIITDSSSPRRQKDAVETRTRENTISPQC